MNWQLPTIVVMAFTTTLVFLWGAYKFWNSIWGFNADLIKKRLQMLIGELEIDNISVVKARLLSRNKRVELFLQKIPNIERLDTFLVQAGLSMYLATFLCRCVALVVMGLFAWRTLEYAWYIKFILAIFPVCIWLLLLNRHRQQRVRDIEAQLPDTLDLMARAMQAGHAFSSALLIVGTEGSPPIQAEFQTTFNEINFGIRTDTALHNLTHRVASGDLRFFVIAVLIQLETGGNLTGILRSLAGLIRDRQRIAGTVRVLSAEGRLSAWILSLLPFLLTGLMTLLNYDMISKLWTEPMGIHMLEAAFGLMLVGIFWMWRMVKFQI